MYDWKPYVSVAQRRADAVTYAAKSKAKGKPLSPVELTGRTIASSFWGKAWCDAMESYRDYENRLERGRSYVRNGSVVDLKVERGSVRALVSGSRLYTTTITVAPLPPAAWGAVVERHAAQVSSLVDLLQGKLPASLLRALADRSSGLFPGPKELTFACSCPDWAMMCKHVAAVLYGVGARFDHDPGLFFLLRGVEVSDLAVRGGGVVFNPGAGADDLGDADLASMFGIELAAEPAPVAALKSKTAAKAAPPAKAAPVAKPKPVAKAKAPRQAKAAPAAKYAPLAAIELRRLGVDARTITRWLAAGVLLPTADAAVYAPTDATGPALRAYLSPSRERE